MLSTLAAVFRALAADLKIVASFPTRKRGFPTCASWRGIGKQ